ncbi:MAG: tetratricopeptide repeat protein [Gammaproteobacteria bacterium]|nr:tetratricopeptide repeat protein [Gammaproteobacteria bacterium]
MNGTFKLAVLALLLTTLFSCAGDKVKPAADAPVVIKKAEYVDVDSDVESDFEKAVELMQAENYEQAVSVLNSVVTREKRLPAPYVDLAIAYNKLGNAKAAEENLINALKLDIGHPVANNELGLLYRKQGKFKAARTAYENAIRDNPEYLPAVRNLGVLCDLYMHDFDCALQQYENYMDIRPDDKEVAIWVVDVKQRLGK